jgi:hypothetical protein
MRRAKEWGIDRFTTMKLEEIGVRGATINGLTSEVGNDSPCSIPYALKIARKRLRDAMAY